MGRRRNQEFLEENEEERKSAAQSAGEKKRNPILASPVLVEIVTIFSIQSVLMRMTQSKNSFGERDVLPAKLMGTSSTAIKVGLKTCTALEAKCFRLGVAVV